MINIIPDCTLTDLIKQKAINHQFDYINKLNEFLTFVKKDIPDIHVLFPQYTPHDDLHHLIPLFHLASQFIGKELLSQLNVTELFLLACALYGHDWGMAVDEQSKQKILLRKSIQSEDLSVKTDRSKFLYFIKERGYNFPFEEDIVEISIDIWREFVRETHFQRSADRIKNYFTPIDIGVADRLAQICQSHGEDCQKLLDHDLYPMRASVLGEVVNIQAIAIYLRLIDLFDIADNRTPYAIWKYVAPTDPISIREWDKHRAIRQVTFPEYRGNIRHILIDGSTEDVELYAALLDLESYCRKEFKTCLNILSEMPYQRYYLDVIELDWNIKADGFKPIPVRFEVDRENILGFLSDELYAGDKLVFLRELLQNSVDAIRVRCELLKKNEPKNDFARMGFIEVSVVSLQDGSLSVKWADNGIGMDEKTIRNFLAVVGHSYYQSDEFKRLNVPIDPISKFGIGLLTCFTVSNAVEIETKRDRNIFADARPLRVQIPNLSRHFRIEELNPTDIGNPGTMIKLIINKDIACKLITAGNPRAVTNYLSKIAGFVDFPILVHEGGTDSLILHPEINSNNALERFGHNYQIIQIKTKNQMDDMVISEDVETAKKIFNLESFNFVKDLNLSEYEGSLSYLIPSDMDTDFTLGQREYDSLKVLSNKDKNLTGKSIRMNNHGIGRLILGQNLIKEELYYQHDCVYRDGILIPEARIRFTLFGSDPSDHQNVRLVVNIPKNLSGDISLSRNQIITDSNIWAGPIFSAHIEALKKKYKPVDLDSGDPSRYLFRLASFKIFHNLTTDQLSRIFPIENWPLPFLCSNGTVKTCRFADLTDYSIVRVPKPLVYANTDLIKGVLQNKPVPFFFSCWRGSDVLIDDWATWGGSNNDSVILSSLRQLMLDCVSSLFSFEKILFVTPPWENDPPLLQEVWAPIKNITSFSFQEIQSKIEGFLDDETKIADLENPFVQENLLKKIRMNYSYIKIIRFPAPFEKSFAYGANAMNLYNPKVTALLRLMLMVFDEKNRENIPLPELNALKTISRRVINFPGGMLSDYKSWSNATDDLWKIVNKLGLQAKFSVNNLTPDFGDFIKGSTEQFLHIKVNYNWNNDFGEVIGS